MNDGSATMLQSDEGAVLSHLDSVLTIENEMKRAQLSLLIRLKNHLTADQRDELRRLRDGLP